MKVFLLVAFAFLQLLPSGYSDKKFINPPSDSIQHPIYVDNVPQDPNTRHARSTGDDFQAFFDRGVSSIIQEEIHKATQESVDENENSHNDVEHDKFKRNTGPPPRPPPPPPRRPPFITDDIRGFNRRYARDTYLDDQVEQELLRERRDLQIPGYKKPTHHDVLIPNWNPNARTQPWQTIGVRRHRRDLEAVQEQLEKEVPNDFPDHSQIPDNSRRRRGLNQNSGDRGVLINRPRVPRPDSVPRWRNRRDLQIPGYKKPTHHTVIIPNWNPNVRTQP